MKNKNKRFDYYFINNFEFIMNQFTFPSSIAQKLSTS